MPLNFHVIFISVCIYVIVVQKDMNVQKIIHMTKHGLIASAGFLLSPLSWWNDLFINVPLAYAFAYVVGWFVSFLIQINLSLFMLLFLVGYWLTNVVGIVLLRVGSVNIVEYEENLPKIEKKLILSFKWDILIACGYSLLIALLVYYDFGHILSYIKAYPEWVVK